MGERELDPGEAGLRWQWKDAQGEGKGTGLKGQCLAGLGQYDNMRRTGWPRNSIYALLTVLEAGKSEVRWPAWSGAYCVLTWWKELS